MDEAKALETLRAAEATAAAAWAKAEKMKADMVSEGVNPMENKDAFDKIDAAYKEHGVAAQQVRDLQDRLAAMRGWANGGSLTPGGLTPAAAPGAGNGISTLFKFGARVTESEKYRALMRLANEMGDAQFVAHVKAAGGFDGPIPLMSRVELQSLLLGGRFGATAITGGSATSAGPFIPNDLQPGFVEYIRKTPTLAQVVGQAETDSDVVEYVTQSAVTNAAAEAGEGNNAAEATYAFATATTNVQEITHYVPITRRAMMDAGQMRSIVEGELIIDLFDRLDTQIASGGGTGDDLEGIYTAVSQAQALGGDSRADALHKAMTQVRVAAGVRMEPDYIGIHPNDYQQVILEQDGAGQYLFGPPSQAGARAAWGVPFLVSTVFTDGTPLVGNFARGARLWIRSGAEVLAGLNDDDFVKRRISLLATMRAAFKTIRPTAFCEVTSF